MIVRAIDGSNDWLFGKSLQDYVKDRTACAQNIKTGLQSFLGDCFFNLPAGIDWFNLLGNKNLLAIDVAIRTVILNTYGVTSLNNLSVLLDEERKLNISYTVTTIYGVITEDDSIVVIPEVGDFLLWDSVSFLTLEDTGLIIL